MCEQSLYLNLSSQRFFFLFSCNCDYKRGFEVTPTTNKSNASMTKVKRMWIEPPLWHGQDFQPPNKLEPKTLSHYPTDFWPNYMKKCRQKYPMRVIRTNMGWRKIMYEGITRHGRLDMYCKVCCCSSKKDTLRKKKVSFWEWNIFIVYFIGFGLSRVINSLWILNSCIELIGSSLLYEKGICFGKTL